jgi:hypothetical protein
LGDLSKIKETFELLKPVVASIENVVEIDSVVDNLDGTFTIFSCNTLWTTKGFTLSIGGNDYEVTDIEFNNSITISGTVPIVVTSFNLYVPYYYHNTIIAQNEELNQVSNSWDKFPMIYLHEITRERFDNVVDSSIDRESDCDLYFMIDSNIEDWKTSDHYEKAIRPMRSLMFSFLNALEKANNVGIIQNFEVFDHARWGIYITMKGHPDRLFRDDLSGTQLRITIPLLKELNCSTYC